MKNLINKIKNWFSSKKEELFAIKKLQELNSDFDWSNVEHRILLYQALKEQIIKAKDFTGLCYALHCLRYDGSPYVYSTFLAYAEIKTLAPKSIAYRGFWWPAGDKKPRLEFLDKCIEMAKKELEKQQL